MFAGVQSCLYPTFDANGKTFRLPPNRQWSTTMPNMMRIGKAGRLHTSGNTPRFIRFLNDHPVPPSPSARMTAILTSWMSWDVDGSSLLRENDGGRTPSAGLWRQPPAVALGATMSVSLPLPDAIGSAEGRRRRLTADFAYPDDRGRLTVAGFSSFPRPIPEMLESSCPEASPP